MSYKTRTLILSNDESLFQVKKVAEDALILSVYYKDNLLKMDYLTETDIDCDYEFLIVKVDKNECIEESIKFFIYAGMAGETFHVFYRKVG